MSKTILYPSDWFAWLPILPALAALPALADLTALPCLAQVMELDLSSLASVRRFAAAWEKRGLPLHVLICNAGIFSMSGEPGLEPGITH